MSNFHLEFDNKILGNLGDNTDISKDSMPDFPSYNENLEATNNRSARLG
ncbi:7235_t:CDS:2 [Funneliformis mosseae]|uniref:7235_t:CDS:1 n=1 Tax=Funneliformis mosseae TaxID=27381 RepID=A0A9N9GZQ1_FUNMO|nr:7235_t:CDS:2 [Funneliformis mosseae]